MHYYIDGYNLLFSLSQKKEVPFQQQREKIISDLNTVAQALKLKITIVFDAHHQKKGSFHHFFDSLEIYFSNESADDFIMQIVQYHKNPQRIVVVTSDKTLAQHIRCSGGQTQDVSFFVTTIKKKYYKRLRKKKKKLLPSIKISKESSHVDLFDYYLDAFQKKLIKQSVPIKIQSNKAYWLESFENNNNDK